MLRFLRTRWQQGMHTAGITPGTRTDLPERFRGLPVVDPSGCDATCPAHQGVDLGACLFSPEEALACPHQGIRYTRDHRMAVRSQDDLHLTAEGPRLAEALDQRSRRLFGRSLRLRSVAAGSCSGCEAELVALGNVVFDLARFGIQFVASPRHADGMVVTGAVSRNMRDALYRTYEAIPDPRLVIAVGACALSGGPFRGSPEVENGVPPDIPVDLRIPGCPPHPLTTLDGILRLLGRLEAPASPPRA